MVYAQGGNIKRLSLPYEKAAYGYLYEHLGHVMVAVDYDCQEKKVYWTDVIGRTIQRVNYDGSEPETILHELRDPQGTTDP